MLGGGSKGGDLLWEGWSEEYGFNKDLVTISYDSSLGVRAALSSYAQEGLLDFVGVDAQLPDTELLSLRKTTPGLLQLPIVASPLVIAYHPPPFNFSG